MREEDLDWAVYHGIPQTGTITVEDLISVTGFEPDVVMASLERLEHYLLIQRSGGRIRLLSIQESLIACRSRHSRVDLPFVIENGVIRAKKE